MELTTPQGQTQDFKKKPGSVVFVQPPC